nr:hypothetical protein [Mucilaginibacter sp. L294]
MKYFAEQDRKFTDMGDIKSYHSVYPVVCPTADTEWGPVIRFDSKVLLPGKQEIQNFIGYPLQVIRVMISGNADYYDSYGFRATLSENDTMVVNTGHTSLQSVLHNTDDCADNEFLEIWLLSAHEHKNCVYYSGSLNEKTGHLYTILNNLGNGQEDDSEHGKRLQTGAFEAGTTYKVETITEGHTIILFVFNGEMTANGQVLGYRDAVIFKNEAYIYLAFTKLTKLFMIELGDNKRKDPIS